ncbi:MAG: hypothetical protein JSV50_05005 [Desulfobacteraceae bacterium]|nr:MAG: hypothetical protein JSV50_05005 [Desulfobacteraceae bacterium]
MTAGPVCGKVFGIPYPLIEPTSPLKMGECFQTIKTAMEMAFHVVRVGV